MSSQDLSTYLSQRMTPLELRSQAREDIQNLMSKKGITCIEEIAIHQFALKQAEMGESYQAAYTEGFMEVLALIEGLKCTPKQAVTYLSQGRYGWKSPLWDIYQDRERKEIINIEKPIEVEEGLLPCRKCKGKKTTHYSFQMRSADEPMTTVVTCMNSSCGYEYTIN